MNQKRSHAEGRFFSTAFGVIIISAGLTWFLQAIGVVPRGIEILNYACPICVVLVGLRILMGCSARGNGFRHKMMEDTDVKM